MYFILITNIVIITHILSNEFCVIDRTFPPDICLWCWRQRKVGLVGVDDMRGSVYT